MQTKQTWMIIQLFIFTLTAAAQDILYKSNGEKVAADVLKKSKLELAYRLSGQKDSVIYHITTIILDSVVYHDGTKENFVLNKPEERQKRQEFITYGRHLTGLDAGALIFYNNLSFSYEYLLLNYHLGIKALAGTDLDVRHYYDSRLNMSGNRKGHFTRIGLNWYFFPVGSFRVITGMHFIGSKYKVQGVRWIYNQNPPNEYYSENVQENRKYRYVVFNTSVLYQITRNLALNAGIDFPTRGPVNGNVIFRSELLLNL